MDIVRVGFELEWEVEHMVDYRMTDNTVVDNLTKDSFVSFDPDLEQKSELLQLQ